LPGKLVIDPSNPIAIAADGTVSRTLPDGQSAGEVVASRLPQGTRYAKAFGSLSAAAFIGSESKAKACSPLLHDRRRQGSDPGGAPDPDCRLRADGCRRRRPGRRCARSQRRGHKFEACHAHQPNPQIPRARACLHPLRAHGGHPEAGGSGPGRSHRRGRRGTVAHPPGCTIRARESVDGVGEAVQARHLSSSA